MQSYKIVTEQIGQALKKFKAERNEDLKEMKALYQELEQKQVNPFDSAVDRIIKNLTFFKENQFRSTVATVKVQQITQKYDEKLRKITEEISKLDKVIKNGCGSIVQKPPTSRIRVESSSFTQREISQIEIQESHMTER